MPAIAPENILSRTPKATTPETFESSFTWEPRSQLLQSRERRVALETLVQDPNEPLNNGVTSWDWDAACTQIHYLKDTGFRQALYRGAAVGAAVQVALGDGAFIDRAATGGLKGALLTGVVGLLATLISSSNARSVRNKPHETANREEAIAYASPTTKRMYDIDKKIKDYENPIGPTLGVVAVGVGLTCGVAFVANRFGIDIDYAFAAATGASVALLEMYGWASHGKQWSERLTRG